MKYQKKALNIPGIVVVLRSNINNEVILWASCFNDLNYGTFGEILKMETNSSQKNLANGLNGLSADKKVWTKPTVEMISRDTIASGANHNKNEGTQRSNGYNEFTIGLYVS